MEAELMTALADNRNGLLKKREFASFRKNVLTLGIHDDDINITILLNELQLINILGINPTVI